MALKTQFLRFVLVGVIATLTTYAVLIALVEVGRIDAVPASVAGYLAGIVVNYLLNYRFTFRSDQLHRIVVPKYLVVMAAGLLLNTLIMHAGVNGFGLHYVLAQLAAIAVVLAWSFLANRRWAFAGQ